MTIPLNGKSSCVLLQPPPQVRRRAPASFLEYRKSWYSEFKPSPLWAVMHINVFGNSTFF